MDRSLTFRRRAGVLRLALALALVFASVQDLVHDHADGIDPRSCYTCHFSLDLGIAPGAPAGGVLAVVGAILVASRRAAPRGPRTRAFEARGPPLLS